MIRLTSALAASIAIVSPAAAQEAVGDWEGNLDVSGTSLRILVSIEAGEGGLSGSLASPDQGPGSVPLANIAIDGEALSFDVPAISGSYAATWQDDGWTGTWSQGPAELPLRFTKAAAAAEPAEAPAAKEAWTIPDDDAVLARLDELAGDEEGRVAAAFLLEGGESRILMTEGLMPGQRFEIGSITKVFTSLLLADMVLKGEISLDDKAADYLPDGSFAETPASDITIADLASHFSGLPRLPANLMPFVNDPDPYAKYGEELLLDFTRTVEPARAPGEGFEYSNAGAGLLGYILGKVAGSDYETALHERIIAPMGLDDTDFSLDERSVKGFGEDGEASPWTFDVLAPTGALRSTIDDLGRFGTLLLDPEGDWAKHVALMTNDMRDTGNGVKIGLGLFRVPLSDEGVLFHNGGTHGFKSSLWIDQAAGRVVGVLVNRGDGNADQVGAWLVAGAGGR